MSKRGNSPGYRAGWCIHYRAPTGLGLGGKRHDTCEAGVPFSRWAGPKFQTRFAQQPCFLDENGQSKPDALPCEYLRRPTPEEIAADKAWMDAYWEKMRVVFAAIMPWRKRHKGKSFGEVIECPVCKGRLHLSISSYNNHVHGRCETEGCVSWME